MTQDRRHFLRSVAALPAVGAGATLYRPYDDKLVASEGQQKSSLYSPTLTALDRLAASCDELIATGPLEAIVLSRDAETTRHIFLMNSLDHVDIRSFGSHNGGTRFWQLFRTCGRP